MTAYPIYSEDHCSDGEAVHCVDGLLQIDEIEYAAYLV